jgi:hypothetical protein
VPLNLQFFVVIAQYYDHYSLADFFASSELLTNSVTSTSTHQWFWCWWLVVLQLVVLVLAHTHCWFTSGSSPIAGSPSGASPPSSGVYP